MLLLPRVDWPLTPMKVVTLWLAVDDSDAENGALPCLIMCLHHAAQMLIDGDISLACWCFVFRLHAYDSWHA